MRLPAQRLFLKIFLWFWVTVIFTGIALVLTFVLEPRSVPSRWRATLVDTAHYSGIVTVKAFEEGGVPAASNYIDQLHNDAHLRACLFDVVQKPIAGNGCELFSDIVDNVNGETKYDFSMKSGIARVAWLLRTNDQRDLIYATELPAGPRAAFGFSRDSIALRWGLAFLVSGFICYQLTKYLTSPILELRDVAQELAAGNFAVRAAERNYLRHDELGDLVYDFNTMADRIEALVSQQRQLISDVSHELRSPLARLNVALDLARERKGPESSFDHMEHDLDRLNEMIGRLLTIATLDAASPPLQLKTVDLVELVTQIVSDAQFEHGQHDGIVSLTAESECFMEGNAELLHSAIENVIRNAIRYTAPETSVEIGMQHREMDNGLFIVLTVRDYGPGVPESELINIFQPFYRVTEARDRQSGGTGLGLAIADRVVKRHGGTIRACNIKPQGLQVIMLFPSAR
jgi:two-component system, OmpR family, sensor histidine kinase CpxA